MKNEFKIGNTVRIGFLSLKVIDLCEYREYGQAFGYILESAKGQKYEFTPYWGLRKIGV